MSTRDNIIAVARRLFAADGYEATSTEKVLRQSGVSRGALYHHFKNKEALFTAVLEAVEQELAEAAAQAAAGAADPVAALKAGCLSFLKKAGEPDIRQIVLVDAHSVVGWQQWRGIEERFGLGLLKRGLRALPRATAVPWNDEKVEIYAHLLLAALMETAFLISRASDPAQAAQRVPKEIDDLLTRCLAG